jgi:hypothetical protein
MSSVQAHSSLPFRHSPSCPIRNLRRGFMKKEVQKDRWAYTRCVVCASPAPLPPRHPSQYAIHKSWGGGKGSRGRSFKKTNGLPQRMVPLQGQCQRREKQWKKKHVESHHVWRSCKPIVQCHSPSCSDQDGETHHVGCERVPHV